MRFTTQGFAITLLYRVVYWTHSAMLWLWMRRIAMQRAIDSPICDIICRELSKTGAKVWHSMALHGLVRRWASKAKAKAKAEASDKLHLVRASHPVWPMGQNDRSTYIETSNTDMKTYTLSLPLGDEKIGQTFDSRPHSNRTLGPTD